jgi:uncharacterized lipoprotein YddW (UPF0748 family)
MFALVSLVILLGCGSTKQGITNDNTATIPHADREFRAAWIATVGNMDWPSKAGLSTAEQQKEAISILDTAAALHMNALIFQARPHCDAMYASQLEPWSSYLTGELGKAPSPYYDPLTFWVAEAHKRGIELHVWFNPYRAYMSRRGSGAINENSIVKKRPDLAKKLSDGMYWLDPSKKDVQDLSYSVVMDVVKRYDIDGVHFDDYFYPYGDGNFPDDDSWAEYTKGGGTLSRGDWRRAAVNTFIERLYKGIKSEKPYVKFGISPFGLAKPGTPASTTTMIDQYNTLYADAKLWLNNGWVDYWTPQLYWPIKQVLQSFPVILGWWKDQNLQGRNLWPGMIIGRENNEKGADEILNEIMIERGMVPNAPGHAHFSMRSLLRDSSILNAGLKSGPYRREALVPPSPWLDNEPPAIPVVGAAVVGDSIKISWTHKNVSDVFHWVIYYQYGTKWEYTILTSGALDKTIAASRIIKEAARGRQAAPPKETKELVTRIAVSAVDRVGNECEPVLRDIIQTAAPAGK